MRTPLDLAGRSFHRLTALQPVLEKQRKWACRCTCGKLVIVPTSHLVTGHTKSCGCWNSDITAARNFRHGASKSREYKAWAAMKQRCYQTSHVAYARYGGKGVRVCDEWRDRFSQFLEDMGPCPSGHTLDRIDGNGDYCPTNCRWATVLQQGQNTSRNRRLTFNGETKILAEWGRVFGIRAYAIHERLKNGWTVERALTEPVKHHGVTAPPIRQ